MRAVAVSLACPLLALLLAGGALAGVEDPLVSLVFCDGVARTTDSFAGRVTVLASIDGSTDATCDWAVHQLKPVTDWFEHDHVNAQVVVVVTHLPPQDVAGLDAAKHLQLGRVLYACDGTNAAKLSDKNLEVVRLISADGQSQVLTSTHLVDQIRGQLTGWGWAEPVHAGGTRITACHRATRHPRRTWCLRPACRRRRPRRDAARWDAARWDAPGWDAAGWNAAGWNAAGWNAARRNAGQDADATRRARCTGRTGRTGRTGGTGWTRRSREWLGRTGRPWRTRRSRRGNGAAWRPWRTRRSRGQWEWLGSWRWQGTAHRA